MHTVVPLVISYSLLILIKLYDNKLRKHNYDRCFHNFNLRIFNLSLKSEQIDCGCFFDTLSDFNVPGSRHKKTR